ncbi:hypothetical protein D1007_54976 [Hordeum vulgare]|nr:hypothetical protein D1007_54976 [Hordeum vulgare]KAI5015500.1 hypothetical protein ZWY2020_056890 [Hordeum vulgare]
MASEGGGGGDGSGTGEGFEERVKRLFGSHLFGDVPSSSFPAASWSVAAGDVERQRWARPSEARDEEEELAAAERADTPCSSAFYDANGCLRGRRRRSKQDFEDDPEDDDEDEEEDVRGEDRRKEEQDEEEEVRVSIGLDPTLDREEEEDKYDRAAFGREDAADRVYMSEIMDDGMNMSINTVVPDLLDDTIDEICDLSKDPQADFGAASGRLKEDNGSVKGGRLSPTQTKERPTAGMQATRAQDIGVKPILKRKEEQADSKPRKRVRFNADVKEQPVELLERDEDSPMVPQSMDVVTTKGNSSTRSEARGVPDYVRNPSKYTCYTLETPESTDESNRRALADLHNLLGRSDPNKMQPETPAEIPSSVTFIPRKKSVDAMVVDEGPKFSDANPSLISAAAAVASDGTDQCEMDEDDPKASPPPPPLMQTNSKMNSRRYRSRADDE